jgi:antitoxin (DNA-binding transcriptional repressor) of toxin-antitoxin stability system
MRSIGIEEARKTLGEIANRAHLSGEVTYLTRHGRAIAVVVPPLRPSRRDQRGATVITTQIPAHVTTTRQELLLETWDCSCGASGVESDTEAASTLALAHQRAAARPILRHLPVDELAQLLRAGAGGSWQRTAAIELLIEHDVWLHETGFRDYILGSWTSNGTVELLIAWKKIAIEMGLYRDALDTLQRGGAPGKTLTVLDEWAEKYLDDLSVLEGGASANAVLRIAASIAVDLPVKLFDDSSSLDNRNRGLVLTALGHLLSRGGSVAFASATTWND